MTPTGLSFLLFPFLLLAVCLLFAPILAFSPFVHFFPFSSSLILFANNKRDKKNGTRLILVDFSSVVFPLFWMIRFRLRSHSSARGFCTGRVSRKSGRFRENFFRSLDLEGETPLSVSVANVRALPVSIPSLERTVRRCNQSTDEIFVSFTSLFA